MHNPITSLLLLGAAIAVVFSAPSSSNGGSVDRESTHLSSPSSGDGVYCVKPEESLYVAPNNDFSSPQVKMIVSPPDEFDYTALWVSEHHHGDGVFVRVEKKTGPLDQDGLAGPGDTNFAWGVMPIMLKGTVNHQSRKIWAELGINVPIFGYARLFSSSGSLGGDGVKFVFNLAIAHGHLRFFVIKSHELWVQVSLKSPIGNVEQNAYILRLAA